MDPLNLEQLKRQRSAVKKKLESTARKGGSPDELRKIEKYLKLIDRRIEKQSKT